MHWRLLVGAAALLAVARPATAQRMTFERTFDAASPVTVDVSTLNGAISIRNGASGRVIVRGAATVRNAINAPANAVELARQIAATPPIEREGDVIRLRPPSDPVQRRAATVSYEVIVPPATTVKAKSESGAIAAEGLPAIGTLQTQSGRIDVSTAAGDLSVSSGSGAVTVQGTAAALTVKTESSAIDIDDARGPVRIRTQSGAVDADVASTADVDVETGSSAIKVSGARKRLVVRTQSGAVTVTGHAGGPWDLTTGSGRIDMTVGRSAGARFELSNRSGAITVPDSLGTTSVSKHRIEGTLGDGANPVIAESGSGAISLRFTQ